MMAPQRSMAAFDDLCRAPFLRARVGRYPAGWTHQRHHHPDIQILLVLGGRLHLVLDGEANNVDTGGLVVLPVGRAHAWDAAGRHELVLFDCCIQADGSPHDPARAVLGEDASAITFPASLPLHPLVEQLEREAANRDLQAAELCNGLLWQFLALVARSRRDHQRLGLAAGDEALLRGLDAFLEQHHPEHIQLDDLAAAVHCSPQHLCRIVRRERGSTPMGLLAALRLRHAQRHLLGSDRAVNEIAAAIGFADPQHFSRWFRQQTGLSPSAFRDGQ